MDYVFYFDILCTDELCPVCDQPLEHNEIMHLNCEAFTELLWEEILNEA